MATSDTAVRIVGRSRAIGVAAWVAAWVGLVLGPLHALSRYATAGGAEDLELPGVRAWAEPAASWVRPLLDWSDPQTVYVTYGKGWVFVIGAATLCALVVRQQRSEAGAIRGVEKVGWWIALPGYVLLTLAVLGSYWTPFLDESFAVLGIPGALVSLVGSVVLGIGLLRRGGRPRTSGVLLVLALPLFFVLSDLVAIGFAVMPLVFAWGLLGRRIDQAPGA